MQTAIIQTKEHFFLAVYLLNESEDWLDFSFVVNPTTYGDVVVIKKSVIISIIKSDVILDGRNPFYEGKVFEIQ